MEKFIPIHGIKLINSIEVPLKIKHILNEEYIYYDVINFCTYDDYIKFISKNEHFFINSNEINKCDLIALYSSQSHNTIEVFNIKLLISAFYFAKRLADTCDLKERYIDEHITRFKDELATLGYDKLKSEAEKEYDKHEDEFFNNYILKGYWTSDYIQTDRWFVKLGNSKITQDDFDRSIKRGFSSLLCDEYDRQSIFRTEVVEIEATEMFLKELTTLLTRINDEDEYSKKLRSVFKIYYDILGEQNTDNLIVTYATLLEALLLDKDEKQIQKVLVVARSACLIADGQSISRKAFIANIIACLYSYRNQIVHEGKTFLELDNEVILDRVLTCTKHIIYFVIKYIIRNNIRRIDEVKNVVKRNLSNNNLESAKEYVTFEHGKPISIIFIEDDEEGEE